MHALDFTTPQRSIHARRAAWALVFLGACARLTLAWRDQGMVWPDEIFQTSEQAHRWVFGYGMVPWEFREGARSWLVPGFFGLCFKLLAALGANSGLALMRGVKLVCALTSVAGLAFVVRLVGVRAGATGALIAAGLGAAFPWDVLFAHRTMGEVLSSALLAWALWCLFRSDPAPQRASALAGVLVGLAFFARYQTGLLALVLWGELLSSRQWQRAGAFAAAALATFAAGGLLDWLTWGAPFHALITYTRFNLLEGRSAQFGVDPWWLYGDAFMRSLGPLAAVLLVGWIGAVRERVARLCLLGALLFALAHSAIAHKELRFLLPAVPWMIAAAAIGLARASTKWPKAAVAIALTCALSGAVLTTQLDFDRLGQFRGKPDAARSPFGYCDDSNRLLSEVGTRADACGVVWHRVVWAGGSSYLHKPIPQLWGISRRNLQGGNYLIARSDSTVPAEYNKQRSLGDFTLYRRDGTCAPVRFNWYMPGPQK